MENSISLNWEKELLPLLNTDFVGRNIHHHQQLDSTNLQAKRLANSNAPEGCVVFAEQQILGRGRLGRKWESPANDGIWMSILLYPNLSPDKISCITLVAGYSVCRAISQLGLEAKIKWPNDIVIGSRKVCGILTEMVAQGQSNISVVVGIGINVNNDSFDGELSDKACSLYMESGKKFQRIDIAAAILNCFEQDYNNFCQNGFEAICEDYNKHCCNVGRQVVISGTNGSFTGKAINVTEKGALLVQTEQGETEVSSGEVSVRGMLGYV